MKGSSYISKSKVWNYAFGFLLLKNIFLLLQAKSYLSGGLYLKIKQKKTKAMESLIVRNEKEKWAIYRGNSREKLKIQIRNSNFEFKEKRKEKLHNLDALLRPRHACYVVGTPDVPRDRLLHLARQAKALAGLDQSIFFCLFPTFGISFSTAIPPNTNLKNLYLSVLGVNVYFAG